MREATASVFQVKAKAQRQLWKLDQERPLEYDLAWKDVKELPRYFERDFPTELYGAREIIGDRCDFFLFVWQGPNMASGTPARGEVQSNPHHYDYFVVPAAARGNAKKILARQLFERYAPVSFAELPTRLDLAADQFLTGRTAAIP